jgi:adenine/guanine/hypoxanthine permease
MAKFAGLRDPVTMDFEGSTIAYCVDAFSISMGALMGTSPVTAFIESATGISGTFENPSLAHSGPDIDRLSS